MFELIKNKYIKILKPTAGRLDVEKEFYVSDLFADTYSTNVNRYSYCNEMIYSTSGAEFLQIKGKEKPISYSNTIGFSSFGFDSNNNTFPICASDFILFALYPEYMDNDYTKQYQYLLLAPPVNSYAIKQKEFDQYNMHEFLLHFDDKYVVRMKRDYYKVQFDICLLSGNVMQTVEIVTNNQVTPMISANGEYIVIPTMV